MSNRSDDFTRANSAVTMGTPSDGGSAWTPLSGTWGIDTNRAYKVATTGANEFTVLETGISNGEVQVTLAVVVAASQTGLTCRAIDASNLIYAYARDDGVSSMFKIVAGLISNLTFATGSGWTNGMVLKLSANAADLITFTNGGTGAVISATESYNRTATKHGLYDTNVPSARFTAFSFIAPGAPLAWVGA